MIVHAITTVDNPYHPIEQFDEWYRMDCLLGYYSLSYVARIAKFGDNLTDEENQVQTSNAIDEIIKYDPFGIYYKVTCEVDD